MAVASVKQAPEVNEEAAFPEEAALLYVEAALEAHRESFGEDEEKNRKMQWAVTGLLERALQVLHKNVYGEA
jgi:hypothetical protein